MIYSRFGEPVTIVRRAILRDVVDFDKRKPDARDKKALKAGSYVIVKHEDGKELLTHLGYLRADNGSLEITEAVEKAQIHNTFPEAG